jgi:uncharacterized phage protein (TIGR01671 family)
MRTFKFRAWNKNTNQMIDLQAITPLALDPTMFQDGVFIPFNESLIIEQFTGLLDKNGREIYEGDLVKLKVPETLPNGNLNLNKFVDEIKEVKWEMGISPSFNLICFRKDYEVIGNIHSKVGA